MQINKKIILKEVGFYLLLAITAFLRAITNYVFIVPNAFAPGGVGGLSSIIYNFVAHYNLPLANTWFDASVTSFVMNLPLIIAAFIKLDKRYAISTCVCIALTSAFMALFRIVNFPTFQGSGIDSGVTVLASIAAGVIGGASFGGMILLGTSCGGTEIIAKISYKAKPDLDLQWQLFMVDSVIVLLSGVLGYITAEGTDSNAIFVSIATPVLYSFITLYITAQVAEIITNGVHSSVVFNIITDKKAEVSNVIINEVKRGASAIKIEGVYTGNEHNMIICVVRKKQTTALKKLLKEVDPKAFVYITKVKEINGLFRSHNLVSSTVAVNNDGVEKMKKEEQGDK